MKKIYVAGASAELGVILEYMRCLREGGYEITYDWTEPVAKYGTTGEGVLTSTQRRDFAAKDLNGVVYADVFWMLVPSNKSVGAWVELGYALACSRMCLGPDAGVSAPPHIVVVSGDLSSIFTELADKRFETHDAALAWLLEAK